MKLAQLKAWMKARQFSRQESRRILMHFTANNQSSTYFDEKQILSFLPTGISREISLGLCTRKTNSLRLSAFLLLCSAARNADDEQPDDPYL